MSLEKGSMRESINNIYQVLINDEQLMRLLYYPPRTKGDDGRFHNPLSDSLSNLVKDDTEYWDLVNERVKLSEKTSDLEEKPLCRIYISEGRRRPVHNNYQLAKQEVLLSVYTHESYEDDMRMSWISDRISQLLTLEHISGMGKLEYAAGDPYVAPVGYKNYRHIYRFVDGKK